MTSRLVLGTGSLAGTLISQLKDRRGDLSVISTDENAVRTLREEGVAAEVGDPTAEETLRGSDRPDSVAVAAEDSETNVAVARAVRRVFPGAFVLAYAGSDPVESATATLKSIADEVVDPAATVANRLIGRVGNEGVQTRKLTGILRGIDGDLAIVAHDNPDPDAIASAVALARIADSVGCSTDICYFGDITHQENRAFVNVLEFDLVNLDPGADVEEYGGVALVDHSRPGVNDGLPEETPVDIVIDHHPPRYPVEARYVDLRSDVGATSTLMVDYMRTLGITPTREVATGLVFGIRVDTDGFTRQVSAADFEATAYLAPHADAAILDRIETPSMSADTLDTIARAITERERHDSTLMTCVGQLSNRDALAQAADRLLNLEDVRITLVYGIREGTIYVSARTRGSDLDLGETLRDAFGQIGSAGGHADMAGAQISLGLLDAIDADDGSLSDVVRAIVTDRFLEAMGSGTHRVNRDLYPDEYHAAEILGEGLSIETVVKQGTKLTEDGNLGEELGDATDSGSDEQDPDPTSSG